MIQRIMVIILLLEINKRSFNLMADYEIQEYEFNLDDLMGNMKNNIKEDIKSFEDLVNLDGSLKRELYLFEI